MDPVSFRTPSDRGRPVGTRGPWRGQYDYVLFTYCWDRGALAALGVGRPRGGVDRAGTRKPTAPGKPTPRTARPAGLAWDSAYCLGATTLHTTWVSGSCTFLCSSHTGHRTQSALSTTHGTVPVASRRRRSQPGVGLDLFVCMYSLSPHIVRFKHVSMRWWKVGWSSSWTNNMSSSV